MVSIWAERWQLVGCSRDMIWDLVAKIHPLGSVGVLSDVENNCHYQYQWVTLLSRHMKKFTPHITCIDYIRWKILEACVKTCVFCRKCVQDVVLSVTFFIFFAIYGAVCVKLAHLSLVDREDTSMTHLNIIIKSEVSTDPTGSRLLYHGSHPWF